MRAWLAVVAVAACATRAASAQEEGARPTELNGFVRGDVFVPLRSADDEFDAVGSTLMLKWRPRFGSQAAAFGEARLSTDEPRRASRLDLREGYLDLFLGPASVRLGKQIFAWGRADGVNPTDNLSGKDLTIFSGDDDDRRLGSTALRADLRRGSFAATAVWIPVFQPSRLLLPQLPANIAFVDPDLPHPDLRHTGGALKLDASLSAVDFSLSGFDGYGPFPGVELVKATVATGPPLLDLRFTYDRRQVLGADFAWSVPGLAMILRGEGAWVRTRFEPGRTPQIEQPYFHWVLGVERTFLEYLMVNVQLIQKLTPHFDGPETFLDPFLREVASRNALYHRQQRSHLEGASARVEYKMLQETLKLEAMGIYNFYEEDYLVRPKVTYAIDDALTGIVGGEIYGGASDSPFGQLRDFSSVYLEMKYSF